MLNTSVNQVASGHDQIGLFLVNNPDEFIEHPVPHNDSKMHV